MVMLRLELFDLGRLVENLNAALADGEPRIRAGEYQLKHESHSPERRSKVESEGRITLIQTVLQPGFNDAGRPANTQQEILFGYLHIQTGYERAYDGELNRYEIAEIETRRPLRLRNGTIPVCRVIVSAGVNDLNPYSRREGDYIPRAKFLGYTPRANLFWKPANLEQLVPANWFLKDAIAQSSPDLKPA